MSGVFLDELSPNKPVRDRGWIILYCPPLNFFYSVLLYLLHLEAFENFYWKI